VADHVNIKKLGASHGIVVGLRSENLEVWEKLSGRIPYLPVAYSNSSIDFQWAYQRGHGGDWQDLSIVVYWDHQPIGIWPLSFSTKEGRGLLSSHGLAVHPPLLVADCAATVRKRVTKSCLKIADAIAMDTGISSWESGESFTDSYGLSNWHKASMASGASCKITHDLFIDLALSLEEIKGGFRKSYKSLVTSGTQHWMVSVLDTANESAWNQFRELHLSVSGRKTRSDETWSIHQRDITEQRGFLVYLLNNSGGMDGGGFFNFTQDEGVYGVGAYKRELFDKPLGHVVQYRAIEELKNRGVRWYKVGQRPYASETPQPSDKEISIGDFKEGFASHMFPRFGLTHLVGEPKMLENKDS